MADRQGGGAVELLDLIRLGGGLDIERRRRRLVGLRSARRAVLRELETLDAFIARDTLSVENHDLAAATKDADS